jgi:hypothetical protein
MRRQTWQQHHLAAIGLLLFSHHAGRDDHSAFPSVVGAAAQTFRNNKQVIYTVAHKCIYKYSEHHAFYELVMQDRLLLIPKNGSMNLEPD